HHPAQSAGVYDRPCLSLPVHGSGSLPDPLGGGKNLSFGAKSVADQQQPLPRTGAGREMNSILVLQRFVDRLFLKLAGNKITDEVGYHQGHDNRIVARDLKDHDYRSERHSYDTGECCTHSYQRIRPDASRVIWHECM